MAILNGAAKTAIARVVLVGPGLSGKTTNLRWLAARLPEVRLTEFPTAHERTAFFDELPVELALPRPGWRLLVKLQTVPGQSHPQAALARRKVLNRPDSLVFVADSDERRGEANLVALHEVRSIVDGDVPMVFQYNKRDVDRAMAPEAMDAAINPHGLTRVLAEASRGVGVLDTLRIAAEHARTKVVAEFGMDDPG